MTSTSDRSVEGDVVVEGHEMVVEGLEDSEDAAEDHRRRGAVSIARSPLRLPGPSTAETDTSEVPPLSIRRESLLWALVAVSFPIVAALEPGDAASAIGRAERLAAWQRDVGLDLGPAVADVVGRLPVVAALAALAYHVLHVPAVVSVFAWLAARQPGAYRTTRTVFVTAHVLTIGCYVVVPTAPPRFVPSLGGDDPATSDEFWHFLQYEFAAVPSGHVVFAAVSGWAMFSFGGRWLRRIGLLYPALVVLVTLSTSNHFVTDTLVALVVVAGCVQLTRLATRVGGLDFAEGGVLRRGE